LAEALALVHDIGHPPFGHAGEHALNAQMRKFEDRFDHNLHALRIVEQFEIRYIEFPGLNLTFEVREGIVKHSHNYTAAEFPELAEYLLAERPPIESQLIDLVDEIAYNTADLDDAFEAHLLDLEALQHDVPMFGKAYTEVERKHPNASRKLKFNEALKRNLDYLATDLIEFTSRQIEWSGVRTVEDVRRLPKRLAAFSPDAAAKNRQLKQFLGANVYSHPAIVEDRDRSVSALNALFSFFLGEPNRMPKSYAQAAEREPRHRVVCDYIAGMTDHFLLRQCEELLGVAEKDQP
jgi:dGTPase